MSASKTAKNLFPRDVTTGKQYVIPKMFNGLAIEFVEVNVLKLPHLGDKVTFAYRLHDNRISPPFISQVAREPCEPDANLLEVVENIFRHYEDLRVSFFKIVIPQGVLDKFSGKVEKE